MAELELDLLAERSDAPIQVVSLDGVSFGVDGDDEVREPHRHDYHELVWVREGCGRHLLDGEPVEFLPGSLTLIGRNQVHVFEGGREVHGAVIRFEEDMLFHAGEEDDPTWLLTTRRGHSVAVPPGEQPSLESTIDTLAAELARPGDRCSHDLERHLLLVILHWLVRWYDDEHTEQPDDHDLNLYRQFVQVLERDYGAHHDAGHYADATAVPAATLSKALTASTGKATKELVTDRVMLEAARLLRFTDLSVSQVADRVGYADPLYFSRAFKRVRGASPQAFREASRQGA